MKISVLTPTYNRANNLKQLYKSLIQNIKYGIEIEWLIMNDGSTDNTNEVVKKFIEENNIEENKSLKIKYFEQENKGKMSAINTLVKYATGEYIIDCDSDDYFTSNAFETMKINIEKNKNEKNIYAFCFLKYNEKGENIGKDFTKNRTTLFDLHFKENDQGERAFLFIAEIRKKYMHELENGEKFITEARMYYKMDIENQIICCNSPIMICEYQEDGYTKNMKKQFLENPCGYFEFFKEILEKNMSKVLWNKRIYAIKHYILFSVLCNKKKNLIKNINDLSNKILTVILYIPGVIMTKIKFKK